MPIYPPVEPTIVGDVETVNRFLNEPTSVQRRVREITLNRFLADFLFPTRIPIEGGAIMYDLGEGLYLARDPEAVNPGAQYPRAMESRGAAAIARATKWGQDVPITDEAIKRLRGATLERQLRKLGNTMIRKVDTVAMATAAAAITLTSPTSVPWDQTGADPFLDVMLADAKGSELDDGFEYDTLVLRDELYARMVANPTILAGLAREGANTVTETGDVVRVAGKTLVRSNRLPAGIDRLLIDRDQFGAMGYEDLESPEYEGDPANGIETWARRDPVANDSWLVRGRRPVVPLVLEPNAGISIEDE